MIIFINFIPACSSPVPHLIGNGFCQDSLNNAGCGFDGGDCCGPDVKTAYCTECECLGENITSKAAPGPFCSCSLEGSLDCKLLHDLFWYNNLKQTIFHLNFKAVNPLVLFIMVIAMIM